MTNMKKSHNLLLLGTMMLTMACSGNNSQTEKFNPMDLCCADPVCVQMVQPYDDFSQAEAKQLGDKVKTEIERMIEVMVTEVHVLPSKSFPQPVRNDANTRYRAEKILKL